MTSPREGSISRITTTLDQLASAQDNTTVVKAAMAETAHGGVADAISTRMSTLTKGRAVGSGGDDQAELAEKLFRQSIRKGASDPNAVLKGLSPQFSGALNLAINASPQSYAMNQFVSQLNQQLEAQLGKSITLGSPLSSGLVPYDLVAPTKLIYPVYSPFRNLVPRVPGQGVSHRAKIMTSISGAMPGGLATPGNRMSIGELPSGGSMTQWPNQLPSSGVQNAVDVTVPYKFFGLTEAVSWLAQFAGQGFEDAAGLASLVLLQEMMLLEERAMISATSIPLSTPGSPGVTTRTAGTGETPLSGVSTNFYVCVTAVNFYGETVASSIVTPSTEPAANSVVDVALPAVPGALAFNLYVGTGTTTPGNAGMHLMASAVGGSRFTLQGALPTATATPPTADTGTSASTDYEGFISTISGHATTGGSPVYPAGFQGSYINQQVGDILSSNALNTALDAMWDGTNGIFADPDDLWAEGGDLTRLGNTLANQSTNNYRLFIDQSQTTSARAGIAVSEYVNPVTRKVINLRVHPYLPQGTAMLMSWKLPQPWSNVGNVWEAVMVQDYLSISWPVVDVTFRYSLFMYGTLFSPAVAYNGILQGLQKSSSTPYS